MRTFLFGRLLRQRDEDSVCFIGHGRLLPLFFEAIQRRSSHVNFEQTRLSMFAYRWPHYLRQNSYLGTIYDTLNTRHNSEAKRLRLFLLHGTWPFIAFVCQRSPARSNRASEVKLVCKSVARSIAFDRTHTYWHLGIIYDTLSTPIRSCFHALIVAHVS